MKKKRFAFVTLGLLSTINPQLSTGAPAPTMKSLDQIEASTPISSVPFTISNSGTYYLTKNLNVTVGDALTIAANQVTLDLNGFTISSTAPSATGYGILLNSGIRNITIANGFIQGGVTNNGSGIYTGGGFLYGIAYSLTGNPPGNTLVSRVSVSGCQLYGIDLAIGDSTIVESCMVRTVGSLGIEASTIKSSSVSDCGGDGISGDQVSDCRGQSLNGTGLAGSAVLNSCGYSSASFGLLANNAQNCYGQSTGNGTVGLFAASVAQNCYGRSNNGIGLAAETALNCYGQSDSFNDGISAPTAQNCSGVSWGDSDGIRAVNASNCNGYSNGSGRGVEAETAINCYGKSALNRGVFANVAISCSGHSDGGSYGLFATSVANTCYGYSATGTGLNAYIAVGCTGTSVAYSFHYNMPP